MKKKVIIAGLVLILIFAYYLLNQTGEIENINLQDMSEKTISEETEVLEENKEESDTGELDNYQKNSVDNNEEESENSEKEDDDLTKEEENLPDSKENQTKQDKVDNTEDEKEAPQQITGNTNVDFEGMIKEIDDEIDRTIEESLPKQDSKTEKEISQQTIEDAEADFEEAIKEIDEVIKESLPK